MSGEMVWEILDSLMKTVHRQGIRVEELEQRTADLERRLNEGGYAPAVIPEALGVFDVAKGVPVIDEAMRGRIYVISHRDQQAATLEAHDASERKEEKPCPITTETTSPNSE